MEFTNFSCTRSGGLQSKLFAVSVKFVPNNLRFKVDLNKRLILAFNFGCKNIFIWCVPNNPIEILNKK